MGCNAIGFLRCYPDEQMLCLSWGSVKSNWNVLCHVHCNLATRTVRTGHNSLSLNLILTANSSHRRRLCRTYSIPVSLEEQSSSGSLDQDELNSSNDPEDDRASNSLSSGELKSLLVDSQRSKLMKKLSESNQQNRFLKRQLQANENAMVTFKKELAVLEQEIKALVPLADEILKAGIPQGTRKINGKYIHTHLHSRLEVVREKILGQIKDVEAAQSKEVHVFWVGMAESVQVMGSFDGWSQGEHLSPEYTGSFTKFSATLLLRPGRYEIKFLVDGEWHLSSELPTIGEGLMENNLLIVE
ncbi:protein PTST, chloroplastic [Silene latifolia]|uniref:protein PTST, chloroplastic n=1 Tax=Silene latifolia TaxID=37657 RepID=UPI003D76DB23